MPVDWEYEVPQDRELTRSGDVFTSDRMSENVLTMKMELRNLSGAQKSSLQTHFLNTARGASNPFTLIDDEGGNHTVRYWQPGNKLRFKRVPGGWDVELTFIRVQ